MGLKQITQSVLRKVEEISGKPVVVQADPSIPAAIVRIARGAAPAHLVKYNPSIEAVADYTACFQCGFIVRLFSTPEDQRFELQTSVPGRMEVESLFGEHIQKTGLPLPEPIRGQLWSQLYDGLIVQLRSMPVALRVDAWLRHDFPDLINQQMVSNARQLNDNLTCLLPKIRHITPAKILHANIAMNAAFAIFWSRAWNDPTLIVPYKTSANLADGEALLKLWDEIPDEAANDRRLIEAWGDYLKLGGWYDFVPNA